METECFQFIIFWVPVSVSFCSPHPSFYSTLRLCKLTSSCIVMPARGRDLLFRVPGMNFPLLPVPQGVSSCQSDPAMAEPSSPVLFVGLAAGNCLHFPWLRSGRLSPCLRQFSALLYVPVPPRAHLSAEFLIFAWFLCVLLLALCSGRRMLRLQGELCPGTTFGM